MVATRLPAEHLDALREIAALCGLTVSDLLRAGAIYVIKDAAVGIPPDLSIELPFVPQLVSRAPKPAPRPNPVKTYETITRYRIRRVAS